MRVSKTAAAFFVLQVYCVPRTEVYTGKTKFTAVLIFGLIASGNIVHRADFAAGAAAVTVFVYRKPAFVSFENFYA